MYVFIKGLVVTSFSPVRGTVLKLTFNSELLCLYLLTSKMFYSKTFISYGTRCVCETQELPKMANFKDDQVYKNKFEMS